MHGLSAGGDLSSHGQLADKSFRNSHSHSDSRLPSMTGDRDHPGFSQTQNQWTGNRSMLVPRDFAKWGGKTAGSSTIDIDQPTASQHLANLRHYGSAMPWSGNDGMEIQASFGQTTKLARTSRFAGCQNDLAQLRRLARNSSTRFGVSVSSGYDEHRAKSEQPTNES